MRRFFGGVKQNTLCKVKFFACGRFFYEIRLAISIEKC